MQKRPKQLRILLEQEEENLFNAFFLDTGVMTCGDTLEATVSDLRDAIEVYFEFCLEKGWSPFYKTSESLEKMWNDSHPDILPPLQSRKGLPLMHVRAVAPLEVKIIESDKPVSFAGLLPESFAQACALLG